MMFDRWRRDRPLDGAADAESAETVELAGGAGPIEAGPVGAGEGGEAVDRDAVGDAAGRQTTTLVPPGVGGLSVGTFDVPGGDELVDLALEGAEASGDVDDVAAFLAGRLVEYRSGRNRQVPAWAVLNKVAHADVDELTGLASRAASLAGTGPGEGREPAWLSAQRSLAADLLEGRGSEEIARVQREVLVPLELWLIERSETGTVSARWAAELAADVLAACGSHGG